MKIFNLCKKLRSDERGIALIMVMGILVVFVLLALAFASSQITENKATLNYYYATQAEQLARGGLEHAVGLLKWDQDSSFINSTPASTPGHDSYYDRWGFLYNDDDGFSISGSGGTGTDPGTNLHPVYEYSTNGKLDSRWITVSNAGDIVGRYAVLVEDESSKLNLNTAGNNDNTADNNYNAPLDTSFGVDSISPLRVIYDLFFSVDIFSRPAAQAITKSNKSDEILIYRTPLSTDGFITTSEIVFIDQMTKDDFDTLSHYVTVYSKEKDQFYSGGWQDRIDLSNYISPANPQGLYDTLISTVDMLGDLTGDTTSQMKQITLNIIDFFDNLDRPTEFQFSGDTDKYYGIEKTVYINEISAFGQSGKYTTPSSVLYNNQETREFDYIELYNPYGIRFDFKIIHDGTGASGITGTVQANETYHYIWDRVGDIRNTSMNNQWETNLNWVRTAPANSGVTASTFDLKRGNGKVELYLVDGGTDYLVEVANYSDNDFRQVCAKNDARMHPALFRANDSPTPGTKNGVTDESGSGGEGLSSFDGQKNDSNNGLESVGHLGLIHRAEEWKTLGISYNGFDTAILDVISPPGSVINGKININTAPVEVLIGIKGFWELSGGNTIAKIIWDEVFVNNLPFETISEITEMQELELAGSDEYTRESLIRDISNTITVSSDVYRVIVLAQAFDPAGNIASERKLEAIVDRGGNNAADPKILYFRWMTE